MNWFFFSCLLIKVCWKTSNYWSRLLLCNRNSHDWRFYICKSSCLRGFKPSYLHLNVDQIVAIHDKFETIEINVRPSYIFILRVTLFRNWFLGLLLYGRVGKWEKSVNCTFSFHAKPRIRIKLKLDVRYDTCNLLATQTSYIVP